MPTDVLIGMAVAWLLTGVITGFVMRRQGHDLFVWLALGSVLGPLVVPLAIENVRTIRTAEQEAQTRPVPPKGGLDLLIAVDGSPDALHAAKTSLEMFGATATSVTLATVLYFEAQSSETGKEMQASARRMLDEVASDLNFPVVETAILFGKADAALVEHARATGVEMLVVGPRGHGASEALFGSVTKSLVGVGSVPVFVGARAVETSVPYMTPD